MIKKSALAIFVVGAVLSLSACASPGAAPAAPVTDSPAEVTPEYAATLEGQITDVMEKNAIPGVVVSVQSPSKGDWSATFGTAELGADVPMSLDDYFRIGSNTKTMTSTVILQLVDEGKLSLDDPISKYRPDVPGGENITITQLSEMRSGLFSYTFDPGFNSTLDDDPQKAWTPDELLAIAFSHPVNAAPGTEFEYSNTNIVLLGVVIEQLTGMSASEAFKERIFEPLGLKHSSLPAATDSSIPQSHARGYQFGTNVDTIDSYAVPADQLSDALDGTLEPIDQTDANPSWGWTAGGAISTPADLAVYVKALVGGGLLDDATQKLRLASIQPMSAGAPSGIGYGLGIVQFAPGIFGHDGQLPGFSTFMVYNVDTGDTIIIGCNLSASPVDGQNAAVVLAKSVMGAMYGASVLPPDPAASPTPTP
ncbi:D-Ala-D-Ala carboxypeptidase [Microbacterium sp. CH12i]|uniref:serine hydrolase domain-containing protein n=1 Tax=Microbacterium sp. CH12i TaxID=1479651 RepID=UPI000460BDE2|nr:serine hydrolase domain-containing protein [Microbacterium sp. CH12i]KDA04925.1 D-Ala-D-Ala carboxypeptidase [Microbacterium sp. CH12i]